MTSKNLPQQGITALVFLLITQYKMPFINNSEATKRSKDQKQTANVQMAQTVGVVFGLSFLFTICERGSQNLLGNSFPDLHGYLKTRIQLLFYYTLFSWKRYKYCCVKCKYNLFVLL